MKYDLYMVMDEKQYYGQFKDLNKALAIAKKHHRAEIYGQSGYYPSDNPDDRFASYSCEENTKLYANGLMIPAWRQETIRAV